MLPWGGDAMKAARRPRPREKNKETAKHYGRKSNEKKEDIWGDSIQETEPKIAREKNYFWKRRKIGSRKIEREQTINERGTPPRLHTGPSEEPKEAVRKKEAAALGGWIRKGGRVNGNTRRTRRPQDTDRRAS